MVISASVLIRELDNLLFRFSMIMLVKLISRLIVLCCVVYCLYRLVNSVVNSGMLVIVMVVMLEFMCCLVKYIRLLLKFSSSMLVNVVLCYCCVVGVVMLCRCRKL